MRASIYARISKDREGAGLGVETQIADCRELAASLGVTVVSTWRDNDVSAYSGKPRPEYRKLMQEIRDGATDMVLTWHTDRLHRSPAELEDYIAACEPRSVATHTVKAGPFDLSTPSGRLVARQLGNVARYEVEHAVERMQRAKQRSADAGKWKGGRRPFGYEADGVTIREDEARAIQSACDGILAGLSVSAITREWNRLGIVTTTGKPWRGHGPRRVLLRPRNAGLMEHRGEIVGPAEWPAVVDPEKWRAVVRLLTDPSRRTNPGSSQRKWLGSGLFRCGVCGAVMRATMSDGHRTYRCSATSHLSRKLEEIDAYVEGVIVARLRQPDLVEILQEPTTGPDLRALEIRVVELRERLNQLADVFAEGAIDAEQLSSGTRRLNQELESTREQIAAVYNGTALAGVADAPDPGAAWLRADLDRRRAVLDALAAVTILPSGRGRPAGWRPGESYFRPESVRIKWKTTAS